jgi:hypothetical protein
VKIKVLISAVLLDNDQQGGLYQEYDVSDSRGKYLVSVGAAEEVKDAPKKSHKKAENAADGDETASDDKGGDSDAPAAAKPAQRRPAPRQAGK